MFSIAGTIPGPITFGATLDSSCLLWQEDCQGTQGSCFLYSGINVAWKFFLISFSFKVVTVICWVVALCTYHSPEKDLNEDNLKDLTRKEGDEYIRNNSQLAIISNESVPSQYAYDNNMFDDNENTSTSKELPRKAHSVSQV